MRLASMRYKDYVWPHNPRVYTIEYERKMAVHKVPFGRYQLQDLGPTRRVMKGEGAFVGTGAYEEFKKLATVFYGEGPGLLVHPVWQTSSAYFVELSLAQEPTPDYVKYTFTFWEDYQGQNSGLGTEGTKASGTSSGSSTAGTVQESGGVWHTVAKGETLWGIAARYGVSLTEVIALNPQIKNPNLIVAGERIRVK